MRSTRPTYATSGQPVRLRLQVAPLRHARRTAGRQQVALPRSGHVTGHLEQMRADSLEPVVSCGRPTRVARVRRAPPSGRPPYATATAWLSFTIGLSTSCSSTWYSATICRQSVSSARSAVSCTAAIAACTWYGPSCVRDSASRDHRLPLDDGGPVPLASGPARPAGSASRPHRSVPPAARRSAASAPAAPPPHRRPAATSRTPRTSRIASVVSSALCNRRTGRRRVALVEDQVEHVQYGAHPLVPLGLRRHLERTACLLDAPLRPADPLRHGCLRHQERGRDLRSGETTDRPQRQCDLRRRRQRRMATEEQQSQGVVATTRVVDLRA